MLINDFKCIRKSPSYSKFQPSNAISEFNDTISWLSEAFNRQQNYKSVVVTHHSPGFLSLERCYKNDVSSSAFSSNLDEYIKKLQPNLWIHGHVHSCHDYQIGKTRVICNSHGYPGEVNSLFEPVKLVEI